jgi:NAD(P)H-dependent FMN reductase
MINAKMGIICGSQRKNSQSLRVGQFIQSKISSPWLLDLGEAPLPLWNDTMWQSESELKKLWKPYSENLHKQDGFVIVVPEWGGMVPASLKNFFLYCSSHELAHKPALIISITSSDLGGSYPIAELRSSSYKNTRILYIPDQMILRKVEELFHKNTLSPEEEYIHKRLDYSLKILEAYTNSLKDLRGHFTFDHKTYPFGN